MKKVLFTATVDSHILQFHLPFLKLFKEKGYEVHVATNGDEEIPYCDVKHKISFERSPFKINNLKAIKQLRKVCESEKFDIIHTHTPMGSVVTRLAAKSSRKKHHTRVIYTAHGLHFFKGSPIINWLLFYPVEKYLSKYTDTLILINKEDYDRCKRKFKKCKDIQYVPGVGIDEEKFNFEMTKKEKLELRKSLGLKEKDFVMIYPAELSKRKRQVWLINSIEELLKKHNDIHLLLPGKDSLNGECQELVKKLDLEKQIHFLGYRKDIPKLLKISDISVSAANQEGLPVNIMEAMYVGLPIVATDCRGNRDLVKDGKNGYLITIGDQNRFTECVEKLYLSRNDNDRFGEQSKYIVKEYLLDKIIELMIEIYFCTAKKIGYLRSTAIYNDSRATKEINTYNTNGYKTICFGWNRLSEKINLNDDEYKFYNRKSSYGSGIKNLLNIIKYNFWIYKNLKMNASDIDIIHACDFDTAFAGFLFSKKYNKHFIYDIYDYYIDCHNLSILKPIVEFADIQIINRADYVIICTEQRKKQIYKTNAKNIVVVHNSPSIMSSFSKKQKNDNKINLGYFGILQKDRLLLEISEKVKLEKNIIFHIGGFGIYEDYFKQLSNKYSNIIFYGKLKYDDVLKKEKECDVLFATYNPEIENHKFSAPNKVYEAMALDLPIIVCKNTGVDELVSKEKIGFIIEYNADEFIDCLKKLKSSKFSSCKDVFEKKYSWEIMSDKLIRIVNDLRGE